MTSLQQLLGGGPGVQAVLFAAVAALLSCAAAQGALARRSRTAGAWSGAAWLGAASMALGVGGWVAYALMAAGSFPFLQPAGNPWHVAGAASVSAAGSAVALCIALSGRPGYRDALLAGAVLAGSVACGAFLGLGWLTRPFRLAHDIVPVIAMVLAAAVLGGLGLAQARHARQRWHRLQSACCLAASLLLPAAAGLQSIQDFSVWFLEADKPTGLETAPLLVVMAACGLVLLLLGVVGSAVDHAAALRADREADRLRQLADSALEGILIHRGERVLDANAAFCTLVGLSLQELHSQRLGALFQWRGTAPWVTPPEDPPARQEMSLHPVLGAPVPVEVVSRRISYRDRPARVLAVRDIRERRDAEARIRYLAHHDPLTGLANRMLFGDRISAALAQAGRTGGVLAVMCLDLDRFKAVNDTLGHAAGDTLLQQVASRLRAITRADDTVARLGGDEFVVLQTDVADPQAPAVLAQRIVDALSLPFDLNGRSAIIGASVGVALHPRDGADATALLRSADVALYGAKAEGRGTYRFYEPAMDARLRERRSLEADLRAALGTGQVALHYQPIVCCQDRAVLACEALMRWTHPERGPVPPAEFIPVAEEAGLMGTLGLWALETACREAASWPWPCRVSVNVSAMQVSGKRLADTVAAVLAQTGLPGARLQLEVTEGLLLSDPDGALTSLHALRAQGVTLVLDDFGTGCSSLGSLHRFPFDQLKVDLTFVKDVDVRPGAQAVAYGSATHPIVRAVLAMAHSLNLLVTVEGVETEAQLLALRAQGCHRAQGYALGRPMPGSELAAFLESAEQPEFA